MNLRKAFAVASLSVGAAGVSAGAMAQNYVSVQGAYTMADDLDFQVAPGTIDTDFDDGYGLGIAFGRYLDQGSGGPQWRIEAELSYRTNDVDSHRLNAGAALPGATGEIESTAVMVNALVDFDSGGAWTPYVGAGAGFAMVDASGFGVSAFPDVLDDDDTVLAYQFIGGIGWDVSPNTALFAEYRWFATEDPDVTTSGATGAVDTGIEYQTNNIMVGARFNF